MCLYVCMHYYRYQARNYKGVHLLINIHICQMEKLPTPQFMQHEETKAQFANVVLAVDGEFTVHPVNLGSGELFLTKE